jgi:hypothetical protein
MQISQLPYIDEHATAISAGVDDVWLALVEVVDRAFSGTGQAGIARILGCADCITSGERPLTVDSTIPGFRVAAAVSGSKLALEGRHRFSRYALIFRLEQVDSGRSQLRAETRAGFPGLAGGVYRLLVIGTGGHVVVVRRLLTVVKRRSEHA